MKKRFYAGLLTFVMIVNLMSAAVFAEEKATIEKICSVCKLDYTFQ